MTTKFEVLLRYLLTELYTPKTYHGPVFGSFFSENGLRANFGMAVFSQSPGRSSSFAILKSVNIQIVIKITIFKHSITVLVFINMNYLIMM